MHGLIRTLFADRLTFIIAASNIVIAFAVLHTPVAGLAGVIFPIGVIGGAVYLAKH